MTCTVKSLRSATIATFAVFLTGCGAGVDYSPRVGPQSEPVSSQGGGFVAPLPLGAVPAEDLFVPVAPAPAASSGTLPALARTALADFGQTCLTAAPDVGALRTAGARAGYAMTNAGSNSALGTKQSGITRTGSFQVNVASSFAFECAVTVLLDRGTDVQALQQAFLSQTGGQTRQIGGTAYQFGVEAFAVPNMPLTEVALLMRAN